MEGNNVQAKKKEFDLHLISKMNKIPGGFLICPVIVSILINTFFPNLFGIGGITTALFREGGNACMGLFLICCGSMIELKSVGMPLYKGTVLTTIKLLIGVLMGVLLGAAFGPMGIIGITPMIVISAITNSNGSLYVILSQQFGDATDSGAISILCLNDGPFFTMVALGATGLAAININNLVATLLPLAIGMVWGNIDSEFRKLCKGAQPFITFFMIFPITASLTFKTYITAGLAGIVLGLVSVLLGFVFFFIFNLFLPKKERNAMGAAIGTTAGNAVMTPAAVAAADPTFASSVDSAAAMISTAAAITLLLCPFVTTICDKYMRKHKKGIYSPEGRLGAIEDKEGKEK